MNKYVTALTDLQKIFEYFLITDLIRLRFEP